MTRYILNLHDSVGVVPDEEGSEFRNLDDARSRAIDSVRSILSDEVGRGRLDLHGKIDIADEAGVLIATVRFSDAVCVLPEGKSK